MINKKLVLKASAGTGKTYRLSLEYVAALLKGVDFRKILVMTFTRKATAEIKNAVLEKIETIINLYTEDKENEKFISLEESIKNIDSTIILDDKNIEKLKEIYSEILKNKEKIKIYTIDSYLNIVFKKIVTNLIKVKNYSIVSDAENGYYYKKILEAIFSNKNLFTDFKEFFFENSEKDVENYIETIKKLIEGRWKYLLSLDESGNLIEKQGFLIEKKSTEIIEEIFSYIENDCKKDLEKAVRSPFKPLINKTEIERENFLMNGWSVFFDKDQKTKDLSALYNKTFIKNSDERESLDKKTYELRQTLAKELFNKIMIPYEKGFMELNREIYRLYDEFKVRDRKFTFLDIAVYTYIAIFDKKNDFIDENGFKEIFFENLDMEIDTIFIDEFQDTSILQWKILHEFIKKTNTVVCVGDEKQSIYGWRGGEKKLFENLEKILGAEQDSLDTSYRSDLNVVNYCNRICKNISEENNWRFEESKINSKKEGYVKTLCLEDFTKEDENLTLNDLLLEELKKINSDDDVAILARTNDELKKIAAFLEENGRKYVLNNKNNFAENPGIFECVEFLKYLVYDDELALFNFISSSLSNFGTEEIEYLLKNKSQLISYLNFFDSERVEKKFNDKIKIFLDEILYFKKNNYYKTLKFQDLINEIIKKFNFLDYFSKESEVKNIFDFYLLAASYQSVLDFLVDYRENKIELSQVKSEKKGIQLMTIHASKGLEFKTVFVMTKAIKEKEFKVSFLFKMNDTYDKTENSIFLKEENTKILNLCYEEEMADHRRKIREEEINNFYVAITRAKSNLIVLYEDRSLLKNIADDKIQDFFNVELGTFIQNDNVSENIIDEEIYEQDKYNLTTFFYLDQNEIEENDFEINRAKFLLETEEKRMTGILVHYFFENIKYATEEEVKFSKNLCYKKYLSYFGERKMNNIFSTENIKMFLTKDEEIFSKKWDYIFSEYVLFDAENKKEYRIDRLMIKKEKPELNEEGEVYIVDFKTGGKNEEQLKTYKEVLLKNFDALRNYKIKTKFLEFNL